DNVIAIAGAAETAAPGQQLALVIFGLVVSIPIIVWGSQLVIKLMDRFPIVITVGGMLLGWIAGTMAITDPLLARFMSTSTVPAVTGALVQPPPMLVYATGVAGALFVLGLGLLLQRRAAARRTAARVD
ncbi:MAG: TerC family protein, partial [Rubrivivax sp.]